jgi:hypothetical protein
MHGARPLHRDQCGRLGWVGAASGLRGRLVEGRAWAREAGRRELRRAATASDDSQHGSQNHDGKGERNDREVGHSSIARIREGPREDSCSAGLQKETAEAGGHETQRRPGDLEARLAESKHQARFVLASSAEAEHRRRQLRGSEYRGRRVRQTEKRRPGPDEDPGLPS